MREKWSESSPIQEYDAGHEVSPEPRGVEVVRVEQVAPEFRPLLVHHRVRRVADRDRRGRAAHRGHGRQRCAVGAVPRCLRRGEVGPEG